MSEASSTGSAAEHQNQQTFEQDNKVHTSEESQKNNNVKEESSQEKMDISSQQEGIKNQSNSNNKDNGTLSSSSLTIEQHKKKRRYSASLSPESMSGSDSRSISSGPSNRSRSKSPSRSPKKRRRYREKHYSSSRSPPPKYQPYHRRRHRRYSRSYSPSPPRYSGNHRRRRSPFRESDRNLSPSKIVGVFGLNTGTTESEIKKHFSGFGDVERVQLIVDKQTQHSKGFAFVYYSNINDAIKAKDKGHGIVIDGNPVRTDFSFTKRPHSPTPGRYLGARRRARSPGRYGRYDHYRDNGNTGRWYSSSPQHCFTCFENVHPM